MVITHQQGGVFGAWIRVRTVGRAQLCLKAFLCSVFGAWIRRAMKVFLVVFMARAVTNASWGDDFVKEGGAGLPRRLMCRKRSCTSRMRWTQGGVVR